MLTVKLTVYTGSGTVVYTVNQNGSHGISASPPEGHYFSHWSGTGGVGFANANSPSTTAYADITDCSATAICYVYYYDYNYHASTGGYIDGPVSQHVQYHTNGDLVHAVANAGYYFTAWDDGDTNPWKQPINVTSSHSYTALFQANPSNPYYTLTITNGNGMGSYQAGTDVAIVANAAPGGMHFTFWSGDITGIADIYASSTTIHTQASNAAIVANYASDAVGPWIVTYNTDGNGIISGSNPQTIANGANATQVTAVPNDGYAFTKWSDNVMTASRTDLDITENLTVTAQFTLIPVVYQRFPQIVFF